MAKMTAVATREPRLTNKQRLFIEQYFICGLNATEAALAVYDTTDRAVAKSIGTENLSKPAIRARIDAYLDSYHMNAEEVLARIAFHARGSMEDFIDPDSGVIDMQKAHRAQRLGLLKRYRTKFMTFTDKDGNDHEQTEIEVELYDAQASLRDIGKHLGLFAGDGGVNINLTALTDEQLQQLAAGKKVIDIEASK